MKRTFALLCALALLTALCSSCGIGASGKPEIALDVAYYEGDFVVEIPKITGVSNSAVDTVNSQFAALKSEFEIFNKNDESWLEWKTSLFPSEEYLQAVMTRIVYPNYGTDGSIYSWNYDIKNQSIVTLEEILAQAGDELLGRIDEKFKADVAFFSYATARAFRIVDENTTDIFYEVETDNPDASEWLYLYTARCYADGTFDIYSYRHERWFYMGGLA